MPCDLITNNLDLITINYHYHREAIESIRLYFLSLNHSANHSPGCKTYETNCRDTNIPPACSFSPEVQPGYRAVVFIMSRQFLRRYAIGVNHKDVKIT